MSRPATVDTVHIRGKPVASIARVLTPDAVAFLTRLHRRFTAERDAVLDERRRRTAALREGALPRFLETTQDVRRQDWHVAPAPPDLQDRRVEITGPVDRKMMINALNSGANVFMADLEDANSPTWENVIEGQANLQDAVRHTLSFEASDGKSYRLNDAIATLVVRPRGWHLPEKHFTLDGVPMSASLFDFGLYFFHNARELIQRGTGPYFYLPKLESHEEAALWNRVFEFAQDELGIPRGTIRATVLIETILAAFEMDEILYELRDHASGLNAGRWDYIFSVIKKLGHRPEFVLPDRQQVTMAVPFMQVYTDLLVQTCHRRGAHAIGGMAAFIPSRRDAEVNRRALERVTEDKSRESAQGFDGTWVAHPDLVPVAHDVFNRRLGGRPHQKDVAREDVHVTAAALLDTHVPGGRITADGVRSNIAVALQYIDAWLQGLGAVAINTLMEDAATAEIARAQLWQWRVHRVRLDDGTPFDAGRYGRIRDEELVVLAETAPAASRLADSAAILDQLVLSDEFVEFMALVGYEHMQ